MTTQGSGSSEHQEVKLIVSDDEAPAVTLRPGMRFEVRSVPLVDPTLQAAQAIGARLCGGSGTCLALIEINQSVIDPVPFSKGIQR
jgi:hypothetical protein